MNKESHRGNKITYMVMARRLWLMILCLLFINSCTTIKDTAILKTLSANHIVREAEDNRFTFDNIETKFDIRLRNDNTIGMKGQLRMQNDSVIWISLSLKLGIEVARVMITEDSLKFINRSTHTYITQSLDNINSIVPIDASISFLQDILVGNGIMQRNEKYKVSNDNGEYKLEHTESNILARKIWIKPKTFRTSRYELSLFENGFNIVRLQYDKFQDINGRLIPSKIIFETDGEFAFIIEIDYHDIKVGEKLNFPFNISRKYNKINL